MYVLQYGGDLGSEFESDSEVQTKRAKKKDLFKDGPARKTEGVASRTEAEEEYNKEERRLQRPRFISMDAYARHKKLVNDYMMFYGGKMSDFKRDTSRDKTDRDVLKEHHKFLWDDGDDLSSWEKRLAKKYYDKLFKEYCITDLSRYKDNKCRDRCFNISNSGYLINQIAMRWRTEKEVVEGKGQFSCGNKKCTVMDGLKSWEVNFAYQEEGEKKNALVKLRLCPECSYKLNYHKQRREVIPRKKRKSFHDESTESQSKTRRVDIEGDSSETVDQSETASQSTATSSAVQSESSVWSGPMKIEEEKSREDEFDEYLADMLL